MIAKSPVSASLFIEESLGRRMFGSDWTGFVSTLHAELKQASTLGNSPGVASDFPFSDLGRFLGSWERALQSATGRLSRWSGLGPVPVRVVVDRVSAEGEDSRIEQRVRSQLRFESIYVTAAVRNAWERRVSKPGEPECVFVPEPHGLVRLAAGGNRKGSDAELFSSRALPVLGGVEECFYCGMAAHPIGDCPSRYLQSDMHGLDEVGRMPVTGLSAAFAQAFSDPQAMVSRLATGVNQAALRREPALAAFVAFFDLTRIYQIRFLMTLAFGSSAGWPGIRNPGRLNSAGGSALYLALDCLRVRKLPDALAILEDPRRIGKSHNFYAAVALAFAALERDGLPEMARMLARALPRATEKEERLYLHLLWSRCYDLMGDLATASEEADRAADAKKDCAEAVYRRAQLSARKGDGDAAMARLRALAQGDREYFLCTLLDPQLLPIQHVAESALREILSGVTLASSEGLKRVRQEYGALSSWLDEGDADLGIHREAVARLEEKGTQGGYYDLMEVADQAGELATLFRQLKDRKRKQLLGKFQDRKRRFQLYARVWRDYPYRAFFQRLEQVQTDVGGSLDEGHALALSHEADGYRAARNHLDKVDAGLAELEASVDELMSVAAILGFLRRLGKHLLLLEFAVIPISLVALPLLERLVPLAGGGPIPLRRVAALLVWVVTPCIALALALRKGGAMKVAPQATARKAAVRKTPMGKGPR